MQIQNILKNPITQEISGELPLECGKTLTINLSWFNNDGNKWTFDILLNLLNRNDFEFQTNFLNTSSLQDALNYLGAKANRDEINHILNFIETQKQLIKPNSSAHENYYGI